MSEQFEVKEQNRLSFEKCFSLVLSGVQFRLFRSAVTVVVISLAVAFLVTMLTDGFIGQDVARAVDERSLPRKTFLFWVDRLSVNITEPEVVSTLGGMTVGGNRWEEFKSWCGLDDASMPPLVETARQELMYLDFFAELPEGVKRPLVGRTAGRDIFEMLLDTQEFERFAAAMPKTGKQMPTSVEDFRGFLGRWVESRTIRGKIMAGHARAVAEVAKLTAGKPITAVLCTADEPFRKEINALGFRIDREELELVKREAGLNEDARKIGDLLKVNEFKNRFAGMYNMTARDVTLEDFFRQAGSEKEAQAFLDAAASVASDRKLEALEVSSKRMVEVARYRQEQSKLAGLEARIAVVRGGKGFMGFSGRTLWLIAVSLMVCVVGIANAMLMSVTERFKEIATMKCLGATDGFIMINFILESAMQGCAGGIVGALAGLILGIIRSGVHFGFIAMENLPLLAMLGTAAMAIVVGVVISIMAAVYPAWVAARLAPMEAMRVE
jgi:hypothetical protein